VASVENLNAAQAPSGEHVRYRFHWYAGDHTEDHCEETDSNAEVSIDLVHSRKHRLARLIASD
jgi:hypothetical protein